MITMENSMEQDVKVEAQGVETEPRERRVPGWVAGTGAAVFLLAVGAFIYWFLGGSFGGSDLIPDPGRAQASSNRGGWRQANADGVQSLPNNAGHFVKAGPALMEIIKPADKRRD